LRPAAPDHQIRLAGLHGPNEGWKINRIESAVAVHDHHQIARGCDQPGVAR